MNKTILVLGGDGYYGWPLSMKLALLYPDHKIVIIDNEWRRNKVKSLGFQTLIPVAKPRERIAAFKKVHGQSNIQYIRMDINADRIDEIISTERPHTIYHLAQQCSAPFSMKGLEEALFTIQNNETGNMRLLWAVRRHVPDAHIIKLGSFGEYATGGIDIAEGYFYPEHNGIVATKPMPYPRAADDIYHISKINDSNYVAMACRVWNLRITDVMQSTIFGFITDEMNGFEELYTRCDYDHMFGTVVNRFLTQVVFGHPLTVYGQGNQRTGLMALRDSVNSLVSFVEDVPAAGAHKVVNHVTETNFSINELAVAVKNVAGKMGYNVKFVRTHDPRNEQVPEKEEYAIETEYSGHDTLHTSFDDVAGEMLGVIEHFKDNIVESLFLPNSTWNANINQADIQATIFGKMKIEDEVYWEIYRDQFFHSDRINLNPGTLGTTSKPVKQVRNHQETANNIEAYPLGSYELARRSHGTINKLCADLWPSDGYKLTLTHSTSQTMNLLALSMLRKFHSNGEGPYRVLTTTHEHEGGIGCFHNLPEYEVHYITDDILNDPIQLARQLKEIAPDVAFFSHVYYDTGKMAPVEGWCGMVRKLLPDCKIILDVAQSLGLYDLPFSGVDIVLGSTHKWLFGPHGGGLLWMKDDFYQWLEGIYWTGTGLSYNPDVTSMSIPGGQDFQVYPAIEECLKLYKKAGQKNILERSNYLRKVFQKMLDEILTLNEIKHVFLNNEELSPVISLAFTSYDPYPLYKFMNEQQAHTKCIKNHVVNGISYDIIRIGFPYYETIDRLNYVLFEIWRFITEHAPVEKDSGSDLI